MTETTKTKAVAKTRAVNETKGTTATAVKAAAAKPAVAKASLRKAEAVKATNPEGARLVEMSPETVARKAYEIFVREGHQHGSDQDHWFRAESELRGKSA